MDENKKEDDAIGSFYMGRTRPPPQPKRFFPPGLLTMLAILTLAGIIWYAYPRGAEKYTDLDVPVVKADTSPIKTAPAEPGGMEVPHQDSTVFEPLGETPAAKVEKLLPAPEEPMDKEEAVKSAAPSKMAPKLDLDLQMKDPVNGTEKVVVKEDSAPKAAAAEIPKEEPKEEAPKKEAPKKSSAAENFHVQLGSFRAVADAKKDWDRLKKRHADLLGDLVMKTVKVDLPGKGIYYRLYAGKVTEDRAKEICDVLKTANRGGCIRARL